MTPSQHTVSPGFVKGAAVHKQTIDLEWIFSKFGSPMKIPQKYKKWGFFEIGVHANQCAFTVFHGVSRWFHGGFTGVHGHTYPLSFSPLDDYCLYGKQWYIVRPSIADYEKHKFNIYKGWFGFDQTYVC